MIFEIAEYLKRFAKVEMFQTVNPDIVFEVDYEKYAIEVETGSLYMHNQKRLLEKVKILNRYYGKNWFFVVTDRNFYSRYANLGETYTKLSIAAKILQLSKNSSAVDKLTVDFSPFSANFNKNTGDKFTSC